MRHHALAIALVGLTLSLPLHAQEPPGVVHFSASAPGMVLPPGWKSVKITDYKRPTQYRLVESGGQTVLMAHADAAATGLAQYLSIDVARWPVVEWRWKISRLIETADNAVASKEDSPVRLVFEFDGDKSKLSLTERAAMKMAETISGREAPYAQLMYIWSKNMPVGSIIPNPRTRRVQMVVASTGAAGVGSWQHLTRNLHEDFRRAFGEEPGAITAYGVLTDTDNTGESVEAWYGDIVFKPAAR